jgi:DNA-binding NarL/FixJ family response regulator
MLATPIAPQARTFQTALVVDDHPLFCDALSITLRAVAGIARTESADSLTAALDRLGRGDIDLVVLDLNLPDVSGLDGLLRLRSAARAVPVVVVSSITDPRMIASAIRAGAAGFVPKHSGRDVFRRAFDAIAAGGTFVPDGVAVEEEAGQPATAHEEAIRRLSQLTRQQAKILELICEGKLNKQIAYDLSIADATVKAHVTAIMRKLGVQTRTQAVLLAREVSFSTILHD